MTVTFFSNFLLLHQTPFCEAMVRLLGNGFRFVATEQVPADRLAMGYEDMSHRFDYTLNSYESTEAYANALKLGIESDIVIIGSAPDVFIKKRLKQNKITFRYSERLFKKGKYKILDPRVLKHRFIHDFLHRNKRLFMLCASAYTASDCRFIFSYPDKTFKWGYFPEVKKYNERSLMIVKNPHKPRILWVGRQIPYKHPEFSIILAHDLIKNGFNFEMTIIGEGPMRTKLEEMTTRFELDNHIVFKDYMPQSEIRRHMEQSDIFIFTSDRQEGWGAVLNEAMNSGCAVVANDEIGSVPFLINDGENGLTYHHDSDDLVRKVTKLMKAPSDISRLGIAAYRTMQSEWNAYTAAKRLVSLFRQIICNSSNYREMFESGPVSPC